MSIFPEYSKHGRAAGGPPTKSADDENGLEARAKRAAQQHTSNAQAQRPGKAGTAVSKMKKHRFDKFARRLAANMITAIRVSLSVFTSPDKERWPANRLLDYLKGAEDLARDMLREIAVKIFISPATLRKRSKQGAFITAGFEHNRAPYFRLGVKTAKLDSPEDADKGALGRSPERSEPEGHTSNAQAQVPELQRGLAPSKFEQRLNALNDVLAHPGKHAARMARALYRAEHGRGQRLIAKSPDDMLLDKINSALDAHHCSDGSALAAIHQQIMPLEPG